MKTVFDEKAEIFLPEPCPICKAKVRLTGVPALVEENGQWQASEIEAECETEPFIDSDEWEEWHNHHYQMPYVDWLPYEQRMLAWVNEHFEFTE